LTEPVAPAFAVAARKAGFLVNAPAPDAVRLAPPLVLTAADVDGFLAALPEIAAAAVGKNDDGAASGRRVSA
jgi:acetylornithine aminotransferase